MRLTIVIPRPPCGKNRRHTGADRRRLTAEAREYLQAVRMHAFVATVKQRWPRPERVTAVELEITTWNTRHDADAATALTQDALERIVYTNDRVVRKVTSARAADVGAPRVEVVVTLLETAVA